MSQLCNYAYVVMIDGSSAEEIKQLDRMLDAAIGRPTASRGTSALMGVMQQFGGPPRRAGGRNGR